MENGRQAADAVDASGRLPARPMREQDVAQAVEIHRASLPPSFFSRLGKRFLREYYRSYVQSPHAEALVVAREGLVEGFVVGSHDHARHASWVVRRRALRFASIAVPALLVRPGLLLYFLRTRALRYARGLGRRALGRVPTTAGTRGASTGPHSVLAHVAVRAERRGSGAGETLVRCFDAAVRRAGAGGLELVTLDGPQGAGGFYERLGLVQTGRRVDEDGQRWLYYRTPDVR